MADPYETLGVPRTADEATVKAAYKRALREHHPDRGGDVERFQEVKRAYDRIQSAETTVAPGPTGDSGGGVRSVTGVFPRFQRPVDTDAVVASLPENLVARVPTLTMALVGLFRADVADLVYRHQVEAEGSAVRPVALVHVRNEADAAGTWNGWTRTEYVGTDGETYGRSSFQMNPYDTGGRFPAHLEPQFAELDPGESSTVLLVVEDLPGGVDVARVRNTHTGETGGGTRRDDLVVEIRGEDRERLRQVEIP